MATGSYVNNCAGNSIQLTMPIPVKEEVLTSVLMDLANELSDQAVGMRDWEMHACGYSVQLQQFLIKRPINCVVCLSL